MPHPSDRWVKLSPLAVFHLRQVNSCLQLIRTLSIRLLRQPKAPILKQNMGGAFSNAAFYHTCEHC